ncbi:hypothetical protein EIQ04_04345 [Xanthomonas campestris pv. raphani]
MRHAHRSSPRVLDRPPSRDLVRHGCRIRASMDGFTACPAPVGGRGPCSQGADHMLGFGVRSGSGVASSTPPFSNQDDCL